MADTKEQPINISKGGIYIIKETRPKLISGSCEFVVVQWSEEGKTKKKRFNFSEFGKRSREQALDEAKIFYEENIKPKHEVWKKYNDERVKQNKKQYKNEYNKEWMKNKWICECGYETTRGYKNRHLQSVYHELGMKKINLSRN